MRPITAIAATLMMVTTLASAQVVPNLMNYQGTLVDANGDIMPTGSYSIAFSIYDAPHRR